MKHYLVGVNSHPVEHAAHVLPNITKSVGIGINNSMACAPKIIVNVAICAFGGFRLQPGDKLKFTLRKQQKIDRE